MLLGASDFDKEDMDMRVSVYRNWFKDSMQRMPHCRWGKCHVLNNLYSNWGYYALGARVSGKIYSESNAFVASRRTEITPWFNGIGTNYDRSIYIRSSKDVFFNGSTLHEFLNPEQVQDVDEEQGVIYKNDKMYPPVIPPMNLNKVIPSCVGAVFGWRLHQCTST
jgi:pectate lyase